MKCPHCGQWNKDSFPHCFQCGEPLNPRQAERPSWRDEFERPRAPKRRVVYDDTAEPVTDLYTEEDDERKKEDENLAAEMTRLRDRRARGAQYLQDFRQNSAEQGLTPSPKGVSVRRGGPYMDPAGDDDPGMVKLPPEPASGRRSRATSAANAFYSVATASTLYNAGAVPTQTTRSYVVEEIQNMYDHDLPPALDAPGPIVPPPDRRTNKRIRGPMLVAYFLVALLGVCITAFLGYAVTSTIIPSFGTTSSAKEKLEDVEIDEFDMDGLAAHRILIPGEEGTQVYISELRKSFVVVGGVATVEAADHIFYDTIEPLDFASMEVSLTPTMIRNGVETRMESIRYTVNIPESKIRLISPESEEFTVSASLYSIKIEVLPNSRVIINGNDLSDTVNDEGLVVYNPSVSAMGNNYFAITVRAPYHREKNLKVTLYRAPMEIPLELNGATLMNTTDEELTILGTTQIGAAITIDSPYNSLDTSQLETTGNFTIKARMTRVGNNTVRIRASYPGKEDSILEHVVYYLPSEDVYTRKAWALGSSDYSELLNNISLRIEKAQIYLCKGTIKQLLSNKPQLAIMDTGSDGREQLVMIENQAKNRTWVEGEEYEVYADVSGVYNNMPRLIGRYSYTVEKATDTKASEATEATEAIVINLGGGDATGTTDSTDAPE